MSLNAEDNEFIMMVNHGAPAWRTMTLNGNVFRYVCYLCGYEHDPKAPGPNATLADALNEHLHAHLAQFPQAKRLAWYALIELGNEPWVAFHQVAGMSPTELFKSGRVLE